MRRARSGAVGLERAVKAEATCDVRVRACVCASTHAPARTLHAQAHATAYCVKPHGATFATGLREARRFRSCERVGGLPWAARIHRPKADSKGDRRRSALATAAAASPSSSQRGPPHRLRVSCFRTPSTDSGRQWRTRPSCGARCTPFTCAAGCSSSLLAKSALSTPLCCSRPSHSLRTVRAATAAEAPCEGCLVSLACPSRRRHRNVSCARTLVGPSSHRRTFRRMRCSDSLRGSGRTTAGWEGCSQGMGSVAAASPTCRGSCRNCATLSRRVAKPPCAAGHLPR